VQIRYRIKDSDTGEYTSGYSPSFTLHLVPKLEIDVPNPTYEKFVFNSRTIGVMNVPAVVTVTPENLASDLVWNITTINGSALYILPGSAPNIVTFNFRGLPADNSEFGNPGPRKWVYASLPNWLVNDSVEVKFFFDRVSTNHQGGTAGTPNWYHYWSDALNVSSEHTYNWTLPTSETTVYSQYHWTIEIGRNAEWPPPGNPPTNNDYIDGFWATNLHEFWHKDHRVHNFAVHGGWSPPLQDDMDGDGICDTDPNPGQPGQYVGGWEALIGTSPSVPNSTEEGGNWAEINGTYGNDDIDWARFGSQWR